MRMQRIWTVWLGHFVLISNGCPLWVSIGSNYACKKGMQCKAAVPVRRKDVWRVHGCWLYACVYIDVACMYNLHALRVSTMHGAGKGGLFPCACAEKWPKREIVCWGEKPSPTLQIFKSQGRMYQVSCWWPVSYRYKWHTTHFQSLFRSLAQSEVPCTEWYTALSETEALSFGNNEHLLDTGIDWKCPKIRRSW